MAQQLQSNGEQVKLLFLSDTPPTHCALFDLQEDTAILRFAIKYLLKLDSDAIAWDELRGQPLAHQIQKVLATPAVSKNTALMIDADLLQRLIKVMKVHQHALSTYQPQSYSGRIVFFRAQEAIENVTLGQAERFWLDFAAGGMEINNVPGNHLTMNYQPQVQVLATALRRNLG
jgi:thioesterase domain-containing protein